MITGDAKWFQVATALNTAVYNALTVKPSRSSVVPGAIVWDDCSCGLLATSWSMTYLSEVFPSEATTVNGNCEAPWEVTEFVTQLLRCTPSPDSRGAAPSPKVLSDSALVLATDGNIMERSTSVALCALKADDSIVDYLVGRRMSVGPEGGCVGSELRVLVGLPRG
jgi:hypothetical protein